MALLRLCVKLITKRKYNNYNLDNKTLPEVLPLLSENIYKIGTLADLISELIMSLFKIFTNNISTIR